MNLSNKVKVLPCVLIGAFLSFLCAQQSFATDALEEKLTAYIQEESFENKPCDGEICELFYEKFGRYPSTEERKAVEFLKDKIKQEVEETVAAEFFAPTHLHCFVLNATAVFSIKVGVCLHEQTFEPFFLGIGGVGLPSDMSFNYLSISFDKLKTRDVSGQYKFFGGSIGAGLYVEAGRMWGEKGYARLWGAGIGFFLAVKYGHVILR